MLCVEARHLIDHGVIPGSVPGRHLQLGFHLAGCDACRAYRERQNQPIVAAPVLPDSTTFEIQPNIDAPTALIIHTPARHRTLRFTLLLGIILMNLLLFGMWYVGLPIYRAYRNVGTTYHPVPPVQANDAVPAVVDASKAVRVATATMTAMPRSTPSPTASPSPTQTPLPSATPTIAPTATATPEPTPALAEAKPKTILLLGIDARPGEGLRARSDALMLVHLDPTTGDAALLSLPRDTWVNIPGYGESKVNAAFFYGESAQPGGGLALAEQTLGKAFNLQIDHAVVIDFAGFRSLIDALDGITVDVPKEIYDPQFPTDDYGYTVAHFLPGSQRMDGATALMFARTRHADSDFERIKRQQLVILGIARRLKERGALQNLREADKLTAALTPFVKTDMPPDLVLSMLWRMRNVDPAKVRRYTVDGSMLWETSVNGAYALVPQPGVLPALGQKLLSPPR